MPEEQAQQPQASNSVGQPQPSVAPSEPPAPQSAAGTPVPSSAGTPTPTPSAAAAGKSASAGNPPTKSLPTAQQLPSLVGEEISGCEILQKTAAGGMGAVYRARHKALNRIVCVKILAPALANDKKAVDLFLTEARAIAELDHPNIVNVYNVGKEKGYYFIVMSFIEGQTLSQILRKQKVLPIGLILDLFEGVLLGLQAAHEKGIIHRDIKPSNILIDPNMQPKVVDFGIAKKVDKEKGAAKSTELAGTAYFIAPEQAMGKNVDTRADLYAVGASLYYVLTGHFPYNGKNTMEIIQKHIKDPIPNPANLRPEIPVWLAQAVQKLMSKKPENRFRTAKEVVDFFRKMRADDQLRLTEENAGKAINLSLEGGLKLYTEDGYLPQPEKPKKVQIPRKLMETEGLVPRAGKVDLPTIENAATATPAPAPKADAPQTPTANVPQNAMPYSDLLPNYGPQKPLKKPFPKWLKNTLWLSSFTLLNFAVAYIFYKLGALCSEQIQPNHSFLQSLYVPLFINFHSVGQLFLMAAAMVCCGVVIATSKIKYFASHTFILLILALLAYIGGLYAPKVVFLDASGMGQNLLSASCFIGYLTLSLIFTWFIGKTYNRTIPLGLLGAALVGLCLTLAYLAAHITYPPALGTSYVNALFYAAILFAMLAIYYLVIPAQRNAIVLPSLWLILAIVCVWFFSVSGLALHTLNELERLISRVRVSEIKSDLETQQPTELIGFVSNVSAAHMFGQKTEFTSKTPQQILEVLKPRLSKMVPQETFTEQNFGEFAQFLTTYYHDGSRAMRWQVWEWATAVPFQRFKEDAPENHIYAWMLWILILFNIFTCAIGMLPAKEENTNEQL